MDRTYTKNVFFDDLIIPLARSGLLNEYHSYCANYKTGMICILHIMNNRWNKQDDNKVNYKIYIQSTKDIPLEELYSDEEINNLLHTLLHQAEKHFNQKYHRVTVEEFINEILSR